jgi:predicted ATPase
MRAALRDFRDVIRKGGGVTEWIWKGQPSEAASIEWMLGDSVVPGMRHRVAFHFASQSFWLTEEQVYSYNQEEYRYRGGSAMINPAGSGLRALALTEPDKSILAQRRDPELYPIFEALIYNYEKVRIFREWNFGRNSIYRKPQPTDMPEAVLEEDFSNLGLFLNHLKTNFPAAKRAILAGLKDLYDGIDDFNFSVKGGTIQMFLTEGDFTIPATRLSDGTLRYLCLLAILCDPEPPPLICIEEPELGLHPDILPKLADLLRAASERTQLIVTTHSEILVDAMTETPESVVVCSKRDGQTIMERLKAEDLGVWLEKYRLGSLWISGQIGGTRW